MVSGRVWKGSAGQCSCMQHCGRMIPRMRVPRATTGAPRSCQCLLPQDLAIHGPARVHQYSLYVRLPPAVELCITDPPTQLILQRCVILAVHATGVYVVHCLSFTPEGWIGHSLQRDGIRVVWCSVRRHMKQALTVSQTFAIPEIAAWLDQSRRALRSDLDGCI